MSELKILKRTPLPNSEVEIEGEISAEAVQKFRPEALKKLGKRVKLDGFREGHIPEKVLTGRVGELGVLEEAASLALEKHYFGILRESQINPVGSPEVSITKLAVGNPMGFKVKVAIVPEVSLPDYKKLSKEVEPINGPIEVTDEEFEKSLPPDLTDESAKIKFRGNMKFEKETRAREKRRLEIIEKIIAKTKVEIPKVLVASEQEKMLVQFKGNIASMGMKSEDYFKHIGKTEEGAKNEWKDEAEKRAKMEIILQKIALQEKIEVPKEEIEKEAIHLLSHHKDADPIRARIYVEQILTNEKVWQFLENS